MTKHNLSTSLSAKTVAYLRTRKHSQADIAHMLGVSEGFVGLVKSKERSLTIDHLERLSETLDVPLGALLIAVSAPPKAPKKKDLAKLHDLSQRILQAAGKARASIMCGGASRR